MTSEKSVSPAGSGSDNVAIAMNLGNLRGLTRNQWSGVHFGVYLQRS